MANIANLPVSNSLVKYGNPVLVSTSGKKNLKDIKGKKDGKGAQGLDSLSNAHTEDILNSILPPREFTSDKQQLWIQSVLSTPATKAEVLALQEELDRRFTQRQARETGICPIREELYAQCFDELIRQITINCAERGLLLVRVRDEIRMTIQAYQTLYESAIAFGMRKSLQAEQRKTEMQNKIKTLEAEVSDLTRQVENLETKIDEINRNELKQQEEEEKNHKEEVEFLKKTNQRFKDELEKLLSGPKK
jgi:dynein light intermediate chain